jgi:hypothetical protein
MQPARSRRPTLALLVAGGLLFGGITACSDDDGDVQEEIEDVGSTVSSAADKLEDSVTSVADEIEDEVDEDTATTR